MQFACRVGGETVYVNRLNPTGITLAACHRVLMNTEQGARAMRHVMVVVV